MLRCWRPTFTLISVLVIVGGGGGGDGDAFQRFANDMGRDWIEYDNRAAVRPATPNHICRRTFRHYTQARGYVINGMCVRGRGIMRYLQIASLIIPAAKKRDSGNYTCNPSNSDAITVMLHVINGEYDYYISIFTSNTCIYTYTYKRAHRYALQRLITTTGTGATIYEVVH